MFNGPAIDAILGLFLLYFVLSLSASAVQEWIASLFSLRSRNLRTGIERLFGERHARAVYAHPLVARLAKSGKAPSYLKTDTLAAALLDVLTRDREGDLEVSARESAQAVADRVPESSPLHGVVGLMVERYGGGIDDLRRAMADWIDEGMDRVGGWYARKAKLNVFLVAVAVTAAANADTIHLVKELGGENGAFFAGAALEASATADPDSPEPLGVADFPIGWEGASHTLTDWIERAGGWLITIAAVSLGAPFWFDLLGKVANLRGAGRKPGGAPAGG